MSDNKFHVISNTHWDREWRFPFQRNRQMLVDMIDKVMEILEAEPEYRAFHLDSQSIVIKDYLEVKPHKTELFNRLVREGRLLIGPWYILPEQYQVGGENLVRNLLIGHKLCNQHGGVSKIGYSPFSWGQISQLPQIYKEFGIDLIMFYRGVNSIDSPKAEFMWEGADGTKAITSRFSTMPRYNFYFYIYRPVVHNEGFYDVEYKWSRGGTPFHFADAQQEEEDYFIINPLDSYHPENVKNSVNKIIEDQVNDFTTDHVIWMEGHDSSGPNIKTSQIIRDIKEKMPHINVVHSTLEDYAKEIFENADEDKLKLVKGERRSAQFDARSGNLYGYTTSARMYLKQVNYDAERWLQYYAEPFNVFSGLLGRDIKDNYLDISWKMIVQNSAHDSIGGCSLDEIHEDMMNRYKQSVEISQGVFERAMKHIALSIDTSKMLAPAGITDKPIFISAVNPNNGNNSNITEAYIDIPLEYDNKEITVFDEEGNEVEFQLKNRTKFQPVLEQMINRPMYFDMIRYIGYLNCENVPSIGFKTYTVVPAESKLRTEKPLVKDNILENEVVKVLVNSDGSFNLTLKANGFEYKNLGYFYSEGEAGHAWVNEPTAPFVITHDTKAEISRGVTGPLYSTLIVRTEMKIPADLKARKGGGDSVTIPIKMVIGLRKGSARVELDIEVDNKAESHRLRIMFPTNIKADTSYGEGQFDVPERSLERPDTKEWIEQPMYDYPMHHFAGLSDGINGIAVLPNGLKEYEVINDGCNTLAVTLLRGFEYIIAPSSKQDYTFQKGAQSLGINKFSLAILPHKGTWVEGNVFNEAMSYANSLRLFQFGETEGSLAPSTSFMEVSNDKVVFNTLKKPENGDENWVVVRIFNPTDEAQKTYLKFFRDIDEVKKVTLEETFIEKIKLSSVNCFHAEMGCKQINTFMIKFK